MRECVMNIGETMHVAKLVGKIATALETADSKSKDHAMPGFRTHFKCQYFKDTLRDIKADLEKLLERPEE
jgi:hypothetical protein